MRVTIPTLDEVIAVHGIRGMIFDVMLREQGPQPLWDYTPRRSDPLDDENRVKLLPRYERFLGMPDVSLRFGRLVPENLSPTASTREAYVFCERDLISGLYAVHAFAKRNPGAQYVFAELDPADTDQLAFRKAMAYASRIGLDARAHMVRLTSGKKTYEM